MMGNFVLEEGLLRKLSQIIMCLRKIFLPALLNLWCIFRAKTLTLPGTRTLNDHTRPFFAHNPIKSATIGGGLIPGNKEVFALITAFSFHNLIICLATGLLQRG